MPKVPKWMADAMESLFSGSYHPVIVTEASYLRPKLKLVRFEGDFSASKRKFAPGNVVEFRISDTEFRHYTPSYFNQEKGICDVLFYLHDRGPGSKWASSLAKRDQLKLLGPGGKMKLDTQADSHFVFGDETSLGLMQCMAQAAEVLDSPYRCLAELDANHMDWVEPIGIPILPVPKTQQGKALMAVPKVDDFLLGTNKMKAAFYLTGNAKAIQVIKKHLANNGVNASQIQSDPYWVEGKTGL